MTPVQGTRAADKDEFFEKPKPGLFYVHDPATSIRCECPCGCGSFMNLPIHLEGQPPAREPSWQWNGDRERPTLRPSIKDLAHCRFHGYLTEGVWTFEADSGSK